jgi:hypothetical protein
MCVDLCTNIHKPAYLYILYVGIYEVRTYVFTCENIYLYVGTDAF